MIEQQLGDAERQMRMRQMREPGLDGDSGDEIVERSPRGRAFARELALCSRVRALVLELLHRFSGQTQWRLLVEFLHRVCRLQDFLDHKVQVLAACMWLPLCANEGRREEACVRAPGARPPPCMGSVGARRGARGEGQPASDKDVCCLLWRGEEGERRSAAQHRRERTGQGQKVELERRDLSSGRKR